MMSTDRQTERAIKLGIEKERTKAKAPSLNQLRVRKQLFTAIKEKKTFPSASVEARQRLPTSWLKIQIEANASKSTPVIPPLIPLVHELASAHRRPIETFKIETSTALLAHTELRLVA